MLGHLRKLKFWTWVVILVAGVAELDSRILLRENKDAADALHELEGSPKDPGTESVEKTIRETSGLLHKLKDYDGDNHQICLDLKYLDYLSVQVSSHCVMLFKEASCKGVPSAEGSEIVRVGKDPSYPCQVPTTPAPAVSVTLGKIIPSAESPTFAPPAEITTLSTTLTKVDITTAENLQPNKENELRHHIPQISTTSSTTATSLTAADLQKIHRKNSSEPKLDPKPESANQTAVDAELLPVWEDSTETSCERSCKSEDKYGTLWKVCQSGTGFRPCPNNSSGSVIWKCGRNAAFIHSHPDYSQCHSKWITEAESSFIHTHHEKRRADGFKGMAAVVLEKVERHKKGRRQPAYFGHEIPGLLHLVETVKDVIDKEDLNEAESLASSSLVILDNVAGEAETWSQLDQRDRASAGTQLIQTMESTMFGLAKACRKFGRSKYAKSFKRSPGFNVQLGSVMRSSSGAADDIHIHGGGKEPRIQLPPGWTGHLPPQLGDEVQFVHMSLGKDYVRNIVPETQFWKGRPKRINSQMTTFTVANGSAPAKITFQEQGIRITFAHEVEACGAEGEARVPRRLHENEDATFVPGSSVCVYWDTNTLDWSSDGCFLVESGRSYTTCECKHLTSFAVLMDAHQYIGKDVGIIVITRLLCTLSSILLLVTIILFKTLRSVRNPRSSVTIHLCICLLIGNLLILTLMDRDNFPLPNGFCAFVGMVTHFTFLSAFAWMGIEGFIVYKMVVDVFESGTENKIRLRLIAYGLPFAIVLTFLAVHLSTDAAVYGGEVYCWLQGNYIWSFIVPVICICLMNMVVLVIALKTAFLKSSFTAQTKTPVKQAKTMVIGTLSLTCILGLTWTFGFLLSIADVTAARVGAYLFTIFNASQGIFIFIFHVWMNKQVRNALRRKVTSWQSTVTSASVDHSKNGAGKSEKARKSSSGLTGETASTKVSSNTGDEHAAMLKKQSSTRT